VVAPAPYLNRSARNTDESIVFDNTLGGDKNMKRDFAEQFTGWSFIVAGVMFWGGWMLMPSHIGTFFQADDFAKVNDHFRLWIWMYRVHIFGMVVSAVALISFASGLTQHPGRVMAWPAVGVATAGTFVTALAAAFYYHHGAWGALQTHGKSGEEIRAFVAALQVDTEYITCLVRFGRVFSGLGILILGLSILKWAFVARVLGAVAAIMGVAAIAVTMLLPDHLSLYMPIFHLWPLWLVGAGIVVLRAGIRRSET
jgi:hypothetical protein